MKLEDLIIQIKNKNSFLCVGLDTDIDKIPKILLNEDDPIFSFNKSIIDYTNKTITLEITGDRKKIIAIEQILHKFGVLEKVRTGKIGITRESLAVGQLYTIDREPIRRQILDSHIAEVEAKTYI